MEVHKQC